jgi:endonuclease/exonuclease/phosphatase family metal-dependent hydrolase
MRFIAIIVALLLSAPWGMAGSALTWNMEYFPSKSSKDSSEAATRIQAAQEVLKGINADILLLQEVNDWKAVIDATATLDGMQVHSVTSFKGSRQQMAVASRWPADSAWYEEFKTYEGEDKGPPRGFAFAALRPPDGSYLLTYSVHLKSNRGDQSKNIRAREEAAKQLVSHVANYSKVYSTKGKVSVLVGGDFNLLQDDPKFAEEKTIPTLKAAGLTWCWEGTPREQRITWPPQEGYPAATFDHFFHTITGASVRVLPHSQLSDHSPVMLEFESNNVKTDLRK